MLKRFLRSPWSGAVTVAVLAVVGGLSWAGLAIPDTPEERLKWLGVCSAAAFLSAIWAFWAQNRRIHELEAQAGEKARLEFAFEPGEVPYFHETKIDDSNCMQRLFRVGIRNLGKRTC